MNEIAIRSVLEAAIVDELRRQADVDECGVLFVSDEGEEIELGVDGRAITIDGDVNVTKLAAAALAAFNGRAGR